MLAVVLGPDWALANRSLKRQLAPLDPDDTSTDRLDASTLSADGIYASVTAAPLFGGKRVVVLQGMLGQATSKGGRGSNAKSDPDLSRIVSALPESTTLIFFEPDLGELQASVKRQLPEGTSISVNEAPRGSALVDYARRHASENQSSLDVTVARVLLDRLFPGYWSQAPLNRSFDRPPSIELLETEIAKLALGSYRGDITTDVIEDLVPQRSEERIFPLLDAVIGGNQRAALLELENAAAAGEDPGRSMSQLYQQIELAVASRSSGRPQESVQAGRALGLSNPNRMHKVDQAAQRARVAPSRQLQLAVQNDRRLKTGRVRNPEDALVELVARVTEPTENR